MFIYLTIARKKPIPLPRASLFPSHNYLQVLRACMELSHPTSCPNVTSSSLKHNTTHNHTVRSPWRLHHPTLKANDMPPWYTCRIFPSFPHPLVQWKHSFVAARVLLTWQNVFLRSNYATLRLLWEPVTHGWKILVAQQRDSTTLFCEPRLKLSLIMWLLQIMLGWQTTHF